MKVHRSAVLSAVVLVVASLVVMAACSKKATNPGGGGGGPELNSGTLAVSAQYPHVFATAGTYGYHCAIHGAAAMSGSVTVAAGQPMNVAVAIANFSYTPPSVSVGIGGTVVWTNNGPSAHTVTSN